MGSHRRWDNKKHNDMTIWNIVMKIKDVWMEPNVMIHACKTSIQVESWDKRIFEIDISPGYMISLSQ